MFVSLLFWSGLVLLGYTYAGYPLLIGILARWRGRRPAAPGNRSASTVSVILCVHNEAGRILTRLENLLATTHPAKSLEVIVVADGCSDETVARVTTFMASSPSSAVRLLIEPARRGKAYGLNRAITHASGEIIVFADARQRFQATTIPQLVSHFADAQLGAVSGSLEIETANSTVGSGVDAYWRLEKFIRGRESVLGTSIGCTGAVYAIRRSLYRPIPTDTLLDDVQIPMSILLQGYRVGFDAQALAWDPQALDPQRERIRKRRTLAGNYQLLFRYPAWLLPWKNRAWWQLLSHKYLRLVAPWALLSTLGTNLLLADRPVYQVLLAGQVSLYLLAGCGLAWPTRRARLLNLPAGFLFLNVMVLDGLIHYLRGPAAAWQPSVGAAGARAQTT